MPDASATGIYISYGRLDADAVARAIAERLEAEFGNARIYMDAGAVQKGEDWTEVLNGRLLRSSVMLVLIDPGWLQARMIAARDRLDDDGDFARHEIEAALKLGLRVIPVLLNGATFLRLEDLPPYLRPLARRQSLTLVDGNLDRGIEYLVYSLSQVLAELKSLLPEGPDHVRTSGRGGGPSIALHGHTALIASLADTRRRVAQVLHPLGGEVLPAITAWRAAFWLALAALLLWGVVWPYLWPALMPTPAAVTAEDEPLPAATGPVLPAGSRFRDCRDATCPWLRVLPAGTFTMGSPDGETGRVKGEGPQHQVTVHKPFAVMETEVTVGLFKAFVAETRYHVPAGCWTLLGEVAQYDVNTSWGKPFAAFDQSDDHPLVCINWKEAQTFARWMTKRTGQPYRLLSEAEWEYAARAGSPAAYSFGADPKQLCSYANVGDISARNSWPQWRKEWASPECDDGHVYTAPVGSFQPNSFGLYDMHGNAWEWVQDCQHDYSAGPTTAEAVENTNCANRLLRGGGWGDVPKVARSAIRVSVIPSFRDSFTGFRLARMLP